MTGEITRSPNKTFLIRRITEALQGAEAEAKTAKAKEPEADVEATEQTEPTVCGRPPLTVIRKLASAG